MSYLITIVSFIIVFGVLVTVHEYGHMFFAKRAGIMCPEFAIGMGPKIFSFRKDETLIFYYICSNRMFNSGKTNIKLSNLSKIPPCPGKILPESLTPK